MYFLLLVELGPGWAPAIADDQAELDLILKQSRISTDDRHFWIGGLAFNPLPGTVCKIINMSPVLEADSSKF